MRKEYQQSSIALTEADKKVIQEGKIPMDRERFETLMQALYVQLDNVHGEIKEEWIELPHEKDEHGRAKTFSGEPPRKHINRHVHTSNADKQEGTPHETWHYMNDLHIAVVDFEHPAKTPTKQTPTTTPQVHSSINTSTPKKKIAKPLKTVKKLDLKKRGTH